MVPNGWKLVNYSEIAKINNKSLDSNTPPDFIFQYLDISSIERPGVIGNIKQIYFKDAPSRAKRIVNNGDIIVSTVRPYLRAFALVKQASENLVASTGFAVLTPNKTVDSEFLFQTVLSDHFVKSLTDLMKGSNYPAVNASDVAETTLLLPPLPEQKKIAEILSSVDEAIASTQAVIDQTRKVKQGILQQLLTRGIGHTKFKESAIGQIPEAWEVKTAGEVCQLITKGTTPRDGNFSKELGDVPYLRVQNLTFDGRLNFYVNPAFISSEIHNGELKRSRTFPGDVLINIVGPPLGKISVVTSEYPEWNINQAIAIFRTSSNYSNKLLAYWLQTPQVLDWFLCRSKKTTSQQNLTLQLCNELPVPLPSLSEQYQIVEHLESIDFQIHTENESLLSLVNVKQGLMQDLLTGRVRVGVTP